MIEPILPADAPRIAFGLLRQSTEGRPHLDDAIKLVHIALDLGIRVLDTADSYCLDNKDFHYGEQLVRLALQSWNGPADQIRVLTKVGLTRPTGKWIPNGSRRHILKSVDGSLEALGVEQIFMLQLHVRDPRIPFDETLEVLAELVQSGKVLHVGLCNVNPAEIRQASRNLNIACVQNELGLLSRKSATDGSLLMTQDLGIPFLAYRLMGGIAKAEKLATNRILAPLAIRHNVSAQQLAMAAVCAAASNIVPLIGATREASLRSCVSALSIPLDISDRTALSIKYSFEPDADAVAAVRPATLPNGLPTLIADQGPSSTPEIVILMGIQGAGKSELVHQYENHGYVRLNRDVLGGKVEDLVPRLRDLVALGSNRVVLDNTYPTRVSRAGVIRVAHAAGIPVRCRFLDTGIEQARINIVQRVLERYNRLLGPTDLKEMAKQDPNLPPPIALQRWLDTLERPDPEEGFSAIDLIPFVRRLNPEWTVKGLLLDVDGTLRTTKSGELYPRTADDVELLPNRRKVLQRWLDNGYQLFFVSNQSGVASGKLTASDADAAFERTIELLDLPVKEFAYCPHPAFPVGCFCRKPLPGLGVILQHKHRLDLSQSVMVGDMDSDAQFANGLGIRYVSAETFF
jgi:HAD superfamily hydrolase (TIGR01662 family)